MKNKEIKEMTTKERRDYLLWNVQWLANCVLWEIRDDKVEIMGTIPHYKQWYRVYRNVKVMLGERVYNSPRLDLNMTSGKWESY